MGVQVPRHLKENVKRIQAEVRENARTPSRPTPGEWAPHVAALIELGYHDSEINAAFGWESTGRYLRKIKQVGRMDGTGTVRVERDAVPRDRLAPEFQAMLDWSPEAFIAFYDRFNYQPMPEHCKSWVRDAFENDLLLLNVPPRHNKSTIFSIWWPVWNLVRNRDTQVLVLSLTDTLSSRWVGYIASILAYGEIPEIFGRFKPEKQDGEIPWRPSRGELMILGRQRGNQGAMQFSVLSRGSGSQILGFEADYIVIDDVTDRKIAQSEVEREKQIDWLHGDVLSRLNPECRVTMIGQRVHLNDLYGYTQELLWEIGPQKDEPLWTSRSYPAVEQWEERDDEDKVIVPGKVLWPEVWPYDRLMKSYALVGGKNTFFTMYQQDPVAADATLVREEWLEGCRDYTRKKGVGVVQERDKSFLPVTRVVSLDPSPTQFNGLVVADVLYSRDQFFSVIVDVKSFKTERNQDLRSELLGVLSTYHPTYLIVEKNIFQYWLRGDPFIEELRSKVTVLEHATSVHSKYDVEMGLESLSYDFETGAVRLPYGDAESKMTSAILESECRNWTREGRLKDDVLMALWFIKFNWRRLTPKHGQPTTFRGHVQKPVPWRAQLKDRQDVVKQFRKKRDAAKRRIAQDA